ncbi:MAG: hypothetical protein P1V97_38040, partial [Planctomycetota bacterium]|nr:hypothetical protein [Planctomycetota bacterium]
LALAEVFQVKECHLILNDRLSEEIFKLIFGELGFKMCIGQGFLVGLTNKAALKRKFDDMRNHKNPIQYRSSQGDGEYP